MAMRALLLRWGWSRPWGLGSTLFNSVCVSNRVMVVEGFVVRRLRPRSKRRDKPAYVIWSWCLGYIIIIHGGDTNTARVGQALRGGRDSI